MRPTAFAVACCGLLCLLAGGVRAQQQNEDLRPLLDRIDRLERDMNLLQRQVYRGNAPEGGAPMAPSPTDTQSALGYEVRISRLEDQMRDLTGQIQDISHGLDQVKQRLDTLASDVNLRLTALEHPGQQPAAGGAPPPRPLAGVPPPPPGAGNPNQPPSQSGTLGQLPAGNQQSAAAATAGAPPSGSPQEQYNYAFGLLRQANYPAAEQALRSFIQRYPNDPLAGNAQYWLGETYYVQKDYTNAAAVFAEGYRKYPKGGKAADNLLKLGMALGQLGQKANACSAFAHLAREFPTAPATVKDRASEEKKRLGCS